MKSPERCGSNEALARSSRLHASGGPEGAGAERAIEQVVLLVLQAGTQLSRDDVRHYIKSTVDVFVQLERIAGKRRIAEVVLSH